MKLLAFTIENYRSIRQSHRLVIGNRVTTLIGPNNEGKSNILRALICALHCLTRFASTGRPNAEGTVRIAGISNPPTLRVPHRYYWEKDFPVSIQNDQPDGATRFALEFELSNAERKRLSGSAGSAVHGLLTFEVKCRANEWHLLIKDENSPSTIKPQQFRMICNLVQQAISPQYIPSVRTAESAQLVVHNIVRRELSALESKKEYRVAMKAIAALEKPVLAELSRSVTRTLKEFLPTVKRVRLELTDEEREEAISQACNIIVNDGTETDLRQKGDGVQSLAAMSLARHAALLGAGKRRIILAVEEPETHLHSRAIHQLRSVLYEIAMHNQVIITTHNPVFVNRENIETNILVSANKASSAKSSEEIRHMLGVRPSDNLRHAEVVLVVEGEDDRLSLSALLSYYSKKIRGALANGLLAIDPLFGSSNLTFKISEIRNALCSPFVFVDNDDAGRVAVTKAVNDRVLAVSDVKYALCRGKNESELEDLYSLDFCEPVVKTAFGVSLVKPLMRGKRKWSERVAECFEKSGQPWDKTTKAAVKAKIAAAVVKSPKTALQKSTRSPFDALVASLEERITASASATR